MNNVCLIGRLTKDPEVRFTQSGVQTTSFTLAVNRQYASKDGERTADFIPVVTWRKTAEICGKYLTKGSQVGVIGRIQVRTYEAQDGSRRYVTEVVADHVDFVGKKSDAAKADTSGEANFDDLEDDPFGVLSDEDVPF